MGYRFRLHRKDLPGCPDIVLPKYKTAIFVHGCFWHRHKGCKRCTMPSTNREYWSGRFKRNLEKDIVHEKKLRGNGWNILTIWECECKKTELLEEKIRVFFSEISRTALT
jgi:DNA mismatch endonuclease (patch repair protein)